MFCSQPRFGFLQVWCPAVTASSGHCVLIKFSLQDTLLKKGATQVVFREGRGGEVQGTALAVKGQHPSSVVPRGGGALAAKGDHPCASRGTALQVKSQHLRGLHWQSRASTLVQAHQIAFEVKASIPGCLAGYVSSQGPATSNYQGTVVFREGGGGAQGACTGSQGSTP